MTLRGWYFSQKNEGGMFTWGSTHLCCGREAFFCPRLPSLLEAPPTFGRPLLCVATCTHMPPIFSSFPCSLLCTLLHFFLDLLEIVASAFTVLTRRSCTYVFPSLCFLSTSRTLYISDKSCLFALHLLSQRYPLRFSRPRRLFFTRQEVFSGFLPYFKCVPSSAQSTL